MPRTDLFDPDLIQATLNTKKIGKQIVVFNSTSSTNDIAAEYAQNKKNDGMVILAEKQSNGRGRAANKWIATKNDSILCSIILTKTKVTGELLSLTAAVATALAINDKAKIKWPNDIFLNNKKIAGILLESKTEKTHSAYIIGIGINCHQRKAEFPKELQKNATSIDIETNATCDRISITKRLLTSLDKWLITAEKNPKKITDTWQQLSSQLTRRITLIYNSKDFTGNCIGVDPQKGLILQLDSGGVRMFDAAHTSIKK